MIRRQFEESGFTLIEVLIAIVVLGFIATGVAASIVLFFKTADGTTARLSLSHDSQLLANYLTPDLDSVVGPLSNTSNCNSFPLEIPFGDVSTGQNYLARYSVRGRTMTRTLL